MAPGQTVLATGHNALGNSGLDLVEQNYNGNINIFEFNAASGTLQSQLTLVSSATASSTTFYSLPHGYSVLTTGRNLLKSGGVDLIEGSASGQLSVVEFNGTTGVTLSSESLLTSSSSAYTLAQGTSVIASGVNLLGKSGFDLVQESASGQLSVVEFSKTTGVTLSSESLLTSSSSAYTLAQGTSVIASGVNLLGKSGFDLVQESASGQLSVVEFSETTGVTLSSESLLTSSSSAYTLAQGTSVIASGVNLLGKSGFDLVQESASGQLSVVEFSKTTGVTLSSESLLTSSSSAYTLAQGTSVIASGVNLLGKSGFDLVQESASGQLSVVEFSETTGVTLSSESLSTSSNTAYMLAPGTSIISSSVNLLGKGGFDFVEETVSGQLSVVEFSETTGVTLSSESLLTSSSSAYTLAQGTSVIASGVNLLGKSGFDLVQESASGQLSVVEFSETTGVTLSSESLLTSSSSAYTLAQGTSVIASGVNLLGKSGFDLVQESASGQLSVVEFSKTTGVTLSSESLLTSSSSAYTLAQGTSVIASGVNLLGKSGFDLVQESASGQLSVVEFSETTGVTLSSESLSTSSNTAYMLAPGTSIISSSVNLLGKGGFDFVEETVSGQLSVVEFSETTGVTLSSESLLTSSSSAYTLAQGTSVISSGINLFGKGGLDLIEESVSGQIVIVEFSKTSSMVLSSESLLSGSSSAYSLTPGMSVISSSNNLLGKGGIDLIEENAPGQLSIVEFSSTTGASVASLNLTTVSGTTTSNFALSAGMSIVNTATNVLGAGGFDLLETNGSGQITDQEFSSSSGTLLASATIGNAGSTTTVAGRATIYSAGTNVLGTGGYDLVSVYANGSVNVSEVGDANTLVTQTGSLTYGGSTWFAPAGCSIIGVGRNALERQGVDIFLKTSSNYLEAVELTTTGAILFASPTIATVPGGQASYLPAGAQVIGTGHNLLCGNGNDVLIKDASGYLQAWEISASGSLLAQSSDFSFSGSNWVVPVGSNIIGTTSNLLGSGGQDVIFRSSTNQLAAWEVNASGGILASVGQFSGSSSASTTISSSDFVIGSGRNVLGLGGNDLFVEDSHTNLRVLEVSGGAIIGSSGVLNYQSNLWSVTAGSNVIGSGTNLLGKGGNDVVFEDDSQHLSVWEFNSSGSISASTLTLAYNGNAWSIPYGEQVVGSNHNALGHGGSDLFFLDSSNNLNIWEFDASGSISASTPSINYGGSTVQFGQGGTVIGVGSGILGCGGSDIFIHDASGGVHVWEINQAGTLQAATGYLSPSGSSWTTDNGTSVLGTATNLLGSGGVDAIFRDTNGYLFCWEFTGNGTVNASAYLDNSSGHTIIAAQSSIVTGGSNQFTITDYSGNQSTYAVIKGSSIT